MRKVFRALQRQLKLNANKNLLHAHGERLLEIDSTFRAALEELLGGQAVPLSEDTLEEIAADAASSFIDRIVAVKQYIQIDTAARTALAEIYRQSWRKLVETRDVESTLRNHHYPRIKAYLEAQYPRAIREALQSSTALGSVPRAEYSAELQRGLFRLTPSAMKAPILDIGCGIQANLVRHLRRQGFDAYGIDRSIGQESDFLIGTDWFDFDFSLKHWGTIVSNLSFSSHFVYAQRYDPSRVPRYMKRYGKILDSLAVEGAFVYAPGVEILEKEIDARNFAVEKWPVSAQHSVTKVTKR